MYLANKIMILGSAGSGKSTLAKQLGSITGNPVVHLDCLYWLANWVARPDEEIDAIIAENVKKPAWIMDGNYSRTIDLRMENADTIIFIDFNRFFCIFRVIKRRIAYRNKSRSDITAGCNEKIDWEFLTWVWNYPKRQRKSILQKLEHQRQTTNKNIIHLKSKKQVKQFVIQQQQFYQNLNSTKN